MSDGTQREFESRLVDALDDGRPNYAAMSEAMQDDPQRVREYVEHALLGAWLRWEMSDSVVAPAQDSMRVVMTPRTQRSVAGRIGVWALSVAAVLLLAGAAVAVYMLSQDTEPMENDGPPIASLIESTGTVVVNRDIANAGGDYAPGLYTIDSGRAQFMLTNRVSVNLHGETRITMHSDMKATLTSGMAHFVCPAGAKGYTVNLPGGARVVDLGTAFTVRIGPDGAAVHVTEGHVRLETEGGHHVLVADESLVALVDGSVRHPEPHEVPRLGSDVVASLDPIAYWRFESLDDGVVVDETGTHHGELVGAARLAEAIDGLGIDLSDTNAHVTVPAHEALGNVGNRLTVSAWVKLDSADHQAIVHNWSEGSAYTLEIYKQQLGFVVAFGPRQGDIVHLHASSPLPVDRWVMLTGVYDGRTISIYVDGELDARTDAPRADANVNTSRGAMTFGRRSERDDFGHVSGLIDDVAIFRRALTPDEIQQIHQANSTHNPAANGQNNDARSESETADR